jgi:hypothetical protein
MGGRIISIFLANADHETDDNIEQTGHYDASLHGAYHIIRKRTPNCGKEPVICWAMAGRRQYS